MYMWTYASPTNTNAAAARVAATVPTHRTVVDVTRAEVARQCLPTYRTVVDVTRAEVARQCLPYGGGCKQS